MAVQRVFFRRFHKRILNFELYTPAAQYKLQELLEQFSRKGTKDIRMWLFFCIYHFANILVLRQYQGVYFSVCILLLKMLKFL
jgi:hypothetical protein